MKNLFSIILLLSIATFTLSAQPKIKSGKSHTPFTFIQVADPQLGFCDKGTPYSWTVDNWKAVAKQINEIHPAFVILTGDLIHKYKNEKQWNDYKTILATIDKSIPVFQIPGNHDIPQYKADALAKYKSMFGYDHFAFCYNGTAFIGLNSNSIVGTSEQALNDEAKQFAWFEKQLKKYRKADHIFVFSHHPMTLIKGTKVKHKPSRYPANRIQKYIKVMQQYGVDAFFAGHTHISEAFNFEGMRMITAGASSHPLYGGETGINIVEVNKDSFKSTFEQNNGEKVNFN